MVVSEKLQATSTMMLQQDVIHTDILILGAGPTGLGAAQRLHQYQHPSWLVLDSSSKPGGLAATDVTPEGFLFDVGGHVIFSHFQYFDEAILEALPRQEDWYHHERVSYVRSKNTWVPYPFQNNIAALPKEDQIVCLNGMIDASIQCALAQEKPKTFDEWIQRMMGEGIADIFMRPYNFKVWAIPTTKMQCEWLGERVAAPDLKTAMRNVIHNKMEGNWGPNATFRFPARGGTGGLWTAMYEKLDPKRFHFHTTIQEIDPVRKRCITKDGVIYQYQKLMTTVPLDTLVVHLLGATHVPALVKTLTQTPLTFSTTHVVGIGLRGNPPAHLAEKCWLYFPEDNCPFYRVTVFSNYSPNHVPKAPLPTLRKVDPTLPITQDTTPNYWSLMFEISESLHKDVHSPTLIEDTLQGALATDLVSKEMDVVCTYHRSFDHGYPTPTLDRDAILSQLFPTLEAMDIFSRGRFGSWKYEVGNQDHSFMLGVEVMDRLLHGIPELTFLYPNIVNQRKNVERTLTTRTVLSVRSTSSVKNPPHSKPNPLDQTRGVCQDPVLSS